MIVKDLTLLLLVKPSSLCSQKFVDFSRHHSNIVLSRVQVIQILTVSNRILHRKTGVMRVVIHRTNSRAIPFFGDYFNAAIVGVVVMMVLLYWTKSICMVRQFRERNASHYGSIKLALFDNGDDFI